MASIILIIAILIGGGGFFWRKSAVKTFNSIENPSKSQKRAKTFATIVLVIGAYLAVTEIMTMVFGPAQGAISVQIWPSRVNLFGMSISMTVIDSWIAIGVIVVIAIILRLTVIRKMKENPAGSQNVLELIVESLMNYTNTTAGHVGEVLTSYIFTVAVFLVACAVLELFGARPPSADITLTFSLAIITFILINWYGIKKKGLGGRLKSLASPTPAVFPLRVIADLAIPISLACRLFGNMFGGMIVIDLIYTALGNAATGITSVLGLYFNVFHPLIQAFIFVTLSLTFINEAIE